MNVTAESIHALERHFVGALSAPSRLWLEAVPVSHVAILGGDALVVEGEHCVVDLGVVESPGTVRQVVRISSAATEPVALRLIEAAPWIAARWTDVDGASRTLSCGAEAELQFVAAHDVMKVTEFSGSVRIQIASSAGDQTEDLTLRMQARRSHPLAHIDFHGASLPRGFDFGIIDPTDKTQGSAYELSFESLTSVPLTVSVSDLPGWLTFEVDRNNRPGPMPGRFFERDAPFKAVIRPFCTIDDIGSHFAPLRIRTNDPRPALQEIELPFSLRVEPAGAFLTTVERPLHLSTPDPIDTDVPIENLGRRIARLSPISGHRAVRLLDVPRIPPAHDGEPGRALLRIRVLPAQLGPGSHSIRLEFAVEGEPPLRVTIPVHVALQAGTLHRRRLSVEMVLASIAVIAVMTLLLVLYWEGLT